MKASPSPLLVLALLGLIAPGLGAEGALPPGLAEAARRSVVELVRAKNGRDSIVYVETPPADLVPYAERSDAWLSLGTAFCLGGDRFATAAHVFDLDQASEAGAWAIRFADGRVLPISVLLRYSSTRDYAEFLVPGAGAPALPLAPAAELNSRVFAAGNALGQGVIIRDGILTSTTPEEAAGAWRWLRFSAPASPGNSGGPLLDGSGRVLGLVVMKSENENLNYALPAAEFAETAEGRIDYEARESWSFPAFSGSMEIRPTLSLEAPISLDEAARAAASARDEAYAAARTSLLRPGSGFPDAAMDGPLLDTPTAPVLPQAASRDANGIWSLSPPDKTQEAPLPGGARLQWGERWGLSFFALTKARGERAAGLCDAPAKAMDLVLAGRRLSRSLGGRDFRISSFGEPATVERFRDAEGRAWILAAWIVPALDFVELACYTPTPSGLAGFVQELPRGNLELAKADARALADFIHLAYTASLSDWLDYIAAEKDLPAWLRGFRLTETAEGGLDMSSPPFAFTIPASTPGLAKDSSITLSPWWYRGEGGRASYSFSIFLAFSPAQGYAFTELYKQPRPGPGATPAATSLWKRMLGGGTGFSMLPYSADGFTYESDLIGLDAGTEPNFAYVLALRMTGDKEAARISSLFPGLKASVRLSEEEIRAGGLARTKIEPPRLGGFTLFESIAAGDEASFAAFLARPELLAASDASGNSPLDYALRIGRRDFALRLVEAGAEVDRRDGLGETPLLLALRDENLPLAREIVARTGRPDLASPAGPGPLVLSMAQAYGDLPERLLARGAGPKAPANALAVGAAIQAGRLELARRLAEQGFPLDGVYPGGWSVLLLAIEARDQPLALRLLELDAAIDARTADGHDALIEALRLGEREVADRLISRGADANGRTKGDWTPLLLACRQGYAPEAELLVSQGALLLERGPGGTTALHQAAASFTIEELRSLLDLGASMLEDVRDGKGRLPADIAAAAGRKEEARLLEGERRP